MTWEYNMQQGNPCIRYKFVMSVRYPMRMTCVSTINKYGGVGVPMLDVVA